MAYTLNRRLAELIDSNGQLATGKIATGYISTAHFASNSITDAKLHSSFALPASALSGRDTGDLSEGSNQYFTNARVQTYISGNRSYGGITASGTHTFTANDVDFIVQDTTDTVTNYIWRHHGNSALYLGSQDAIVNIRSPLQINSTQVFDTSRNMSNVGTAVFNGAVTLNSSLNVASTVGIAGTTVIDSSRNLTNIGTISSGNITTSGYLRGPASFTIDPAAHGDNTGTVVIAGNLQVDGTTTTINSTTLTVDDKKITVAEGSGSASAANESGLEVGVGATGASSNPSVIYYSSGNEWILNRNTEISGQLLVQADADSSLLMGNAGTNASRIYAGASQELYIGGNNTYKLRFKTSGDIVMDNGGKLGVGIASPNDPLEVAGTLTSQHNIVSNTRYPMLSVRSNRSINDYGGLLKQYARLDLVTPGTNTSGESSAHGYGDLRFSLTSASDTVLDDVMTIRYNGNVGIGTNTPSQKLEVANAGFAYVRTRSTSGSFTGFDIGQHSSGAVYLNNRDNTSLIFQTNNTPQGAFDSNGNFGVGTTSPTNSANYTTLDIRGSNGGQILLGRSSQFDFFAFTSANSTSIGTAVGQDLIIRTNSNGGNNERMRITSAGDVSIAAAGGLYFNGGTRSTSTNAQAYIRESGLNLDIKGNDNVRLLGDGGNIILHADYTGQVRVTGDLSVAKSSITAWSSGYNSLQVGGRGFVGAHSSSDLYLGQNAYFNSGWKYESSVAASLTQHSGGQITHFVAAAGTAGNAITWTRAIHIKNNGYVGFGGSSNPSFPVEINSTTGADALQLVGRSGDNISSLAFANNGKSISSYIQSNSTWMRVRADGGFHFKRGGTPSTSETNAFTITDANLIVTADSYLNGDLKVGTDSSNPGAIYITDNSTTAYTLGIIGTGTRQFEFRGSSSGADYYTSFTNPSSGGHNLTVNGNFTAVSTSNSAILINGNSGGLSFSGGNNRIYFNSARALEGNGTTLQVGEGHTTGLYQMATNTFYGNINPASDDTYDLGSGSQRWRNVYTGDLHLSNEGKEEGNEVDGTTGNWTIQEGEEHLYIINNKSGKKFRFALEEIE